MVDQEADTRLSLRAQVRREAGRTLERTRRTPEILLGLHDPEVGLTPKDTLYARGAARLYRYRPMTDEVYRVPILFVMSLVSKSYILDLAPGQSFVEYLLKQGYDIYMIDWGVPRAEDHTLRLEDYVLDMLPRCVEEMQRTSGQEDFSFLGYCMGGIFGLTYAAAFPESGLRNLACVATPVDFDGMGLLKRWADPQFFDVDQLVDTYGNVPAAFIRTSLEMLRPLERMAGYMRLWENLWDPQYVYNWRIRYNWAQDQIAFPGETFRQMTKELMWNNKLIGGELQLGGRCINLQNVRCSVMNAMAQFDHIAPYEATKPMLDAVGSHDKQELVARGGHVSLIAGANAITRLWPTMDQWLSVRSV